MKTHREGWYDPDWVAVADDGTSAQDVWRWLAVVKCWVKMWFARKEKQVREMYGKDDDA